MRRLMVINCAALSPDMVGRSAAAPNLSRLAGDGCMMELWPPLPAVTCTVQATLLTARPPAEHGIVANGFYDAALAEVRFWEQSARLVEAPPAWAARESRPRAAMLFWQNSIYADVDCMITPRPMHTESGLINDCYSRPAGLYAALREKLGEFPLHRYWGPMAGLESSQWIAAATEEVWRSLRPDLCLTYLPHMDYNTQRLGPGAPPLEGDLRALDALVGRLADLARGDGAGVVVLSEYSLAPVRRAVAVNRILREAGLVALRELAGREYLDCGACRAFAMADHQVAHVYFPAVSGGDRRAAVARARDLLAAADGVAEVLDAEAQSSRGLRHRRSGDLVCVAEPDAWFSYYWWLDDQRAPDFARTVDIHRKPGYDPVELFFDPKTRSIPLDASLVRGSHGRAEPDDPRGVVIVASPEQGLAGRRSIRADEVASAVLGL
jgi:predicted AlkP superfamily pyrophosphatase or phosphodiesterase